MSDGAVIGLDRTAVPGRVGTVKIQLMRLATDPAQRRRPSKTATAGSSTRLPTRWTATARSCTTPSRNCPVSRVPPTNSGNLVDTIKNPQIFVTALDSNVQIVQFQDRLASLTSVVDGSRSDLDAALTNLSSAVVDVQRFIVCQPNQTAEQLQHLSSIVVKNLPTTRWC